MKIVGPGNAYVAEAKRLVFGRVGIDAIAGPSEIVVLADETADPRYVAADLLSQAEHGSGDERAILVTTSRALADRVSREIELQSKALPRREAIEDVLSRHGAIVLAASLEDAIAAVDRIAPEHLEVLTKDRRASRRENLERGRDLHRPVVARSRGRLLRRTEPRAPDRRKPRASRHLWESRIS